MTDKKWWEKLICRVCAVENNIRRGKNWVIVGTCSWCGERHVLFTNLDYEPQEETDGQ